MAVMLDRSHVIATAGGGSNGGDTNDDGFNRCGFRWQFNR